MSVERNRALSRRLYEEVFGLGNLDAADEILDADCVTHGPGTPAATGTEGIKRQAQLLRTAFPDLRAVCRGQIAEADQVATRWTTTGTHTGPMTTAGGVSEPRGEPIEFDELRIDRFLDGANGVRPAELRGAGGGGRRVRGETPFVVGRLHATLPAPSSE